MNKCVRNSVQCCVVGIASLQLSCKNIYQPLDRNRASTVSASPPTNPGGVDLRTADPIDIRWTKGSTAPTPTLANVILAVNENTGTQLTATDFQLTEERTLAGSKYWRFVQLKDGDVIHNRSIRIWASPNNAYLIQAEAYLDRPSANAAPAPTARPVKPRSPGQVDQSSKEQQLISVAKKMVQSFPEDTKIQGISVKREWHRSVLMLRVELKGRHGRHAFLFNYESGAFVEHTYKGFLENDSQNQDNSSDEYSLQAKIFPIWEFPEGNPDAVTELVAMPLKHLNNSVRIGKIDTYASLATTPLLDTKFDSELGNLPEGRAKGLWNNDYLRGAIEHIFTALPATANTPRTGHPSRLVGRYAGIFLHPDAQAQFPNLTFQPDISPQYYGKWEQGANGDWENKGFSLQYGVPVATPDAVLGRQPFNSAGRPDNLPQRLINSGFDEVQVYAGITYLFEALQALGFTDQELSTRPITAILFDPSKDSMDNAFYDNDTINFSTYSPDAQNYARDNTTIWHELGHGIMDRMMGPHLNFADTGGLSEGMADFLAQLVINSRSKGADFPGFHKMRIFNKTAFHVTNEVHDDGEAYGGAMNDILESAIASYGFEQGLKRTGDLILETMRLTRDHPVLTAEVWFERMIFADSLERDIPGLARNPGDMRQHIVDVLASRNFSVEATKKPAAFVLRNDEEEITSETAGSRNNPVLVTMRPQETRDFRLSGEINPGDFNGFQFPLKIRVMYVGGPLQGAANWLGQQNRFTDYAIATPGQRISFPVTLQGTCENINRDEGGCKDYIYIEVWNNGETQNPIAKKRFYVILNPR